MVPVRGISSCILPSLTSGHGEFRDRCCSMAPCFSNEQQLAYFYGHTLSLGKKNKVCLTSLKNMPAASLGSLCPLNRVFYYVGFIFSLKASHEPPCYETKQSVLSHCTWHVHLRSLGFVSHAQNRVLLPSDQPQERLLT